MSPPLVKIPLKDASKLRHTASRRSTAKVSIPWRLGSFRNWQPDKCNILHHDLYIILKNKERTLNFAFRSGLRRPCRLLDNGNIDVIFFARAVSAPGAELRRSGYGCSKTSDVHVPASATVWVVACKKATGECLAEATLIVTYFDSSW